MALHSGTRHPLNPAVGDVITSLGWSYRLVVVAGSDTGRGLGGIPTNAGWRKDLPIHHNRGLHWSPGLSCGTPWALAHLQCNPGCVPAFHRVGGWGVRPATRCVRYHFNCAVFPAVSRSLP